MARPGVVVALALVVGGLTALLWTASTSGTADRPIRASSPHMAAALPNAAKAAYGRRVLVIHTPPLEAPHGEMLESARAPGGWELYDVAPAGATEFTAAMEATAAAAAADWEAGRRLSPKMIERLATAGVSVVFVEDGRRVVSPERAAEEAGVSPEATVPGLRIRAAEPVMREALDDEGRTVLRSVSRTRDFEDGLWGGSIVVEVDEPGRYVFAWPAEGARVTVDGAVTESASYSAELPLVMLELPAGNVAVDVRYADSDGRAVIASAGALAITIGLISLLLAFRAHPDRDEEPAPEHAADEGDAGDVV